MRFIGLLVVLSMIFSDQSDLRYYRVSFYLDAALYAAPHNAVNLARYVDDINFILSKNTNARLTFDPQDIYQFTDHPYEGGYIGTLPTTFKIDIYAEQSALFCNGTSNTDPNTGDVVLDGGGEHRAMCWQAVYNPDATDLDVNRYWYQITTMLHELAHGFGAGLPEYYWLAVVPDNTGQAPILDVNFWNADDPYWSTHPDFMDDPMTHGIYDPATLNTRAKLLDRVQYMDLTAHVINGVLRNGWDTADMVNVHILDAGGNPVAGATVDIWTSPDNTISHTTQATDATGTVSFRWGWARNSVTSARIIKVYKGDVSAARFVTVLDSDIARLMKGAEALDIYVSLPGEPGQNCGPDHREGCVVPVMPYNNYMPIVSNN
jgi:hypothetical protein